MDYIKKKNPPDLDAQNAYKDGYFVEALQIIHSFVENQCRSFLMLVGSVKFGAELSETWDLTDTISFHNCIKVLFILNQITKDEYIFHNKLNSLRNNVIHNIYKEPYEKLFLGVPRNEYDSIFNESIENLYFFTNKAEEIVK